MYFPTELTRLWQRREKAESSAWPNLKSRKEEKREKKGKNRIRRRRKERRREKIEEAEK